MIEKPTEKPIDIATVVIQPNGLPHNVHSMVPNQPPRWLGKLKWLVPTALLLIGALSVVPGLLQKWRVDASTQLFLYFLDSVFRQVGNDIRCFLRRTCLPLD